jgi:hypothetical protein
MILSIGNEIEEIEKKYRQNLKSMVCRNIAHEASLEISQKS